MKNYSNFEVDKLKFNRKQEIVKRNDHVNRGGLTNACNVNPELTPMNRVLIGEKDTNWYHEFELRYNELDHYKNGDNRALRKDAVILLEGLAYMSHDAMQFVDLDEWVAAEVEWVQKKYGKENVIHAVLHVDESTWHIHFAILPVLDGRFCAKEINGGPSAFRKLQDEHAKEMARFGLRRGLRAGANRMQYQDMHHLYDKTMSSVTDLPMPEQGESIEEYRNRVNEMYRGVQISRNALKIENDKLQKIRDYAHELEDKVDALMEQIRNLFEEIKKLRHRKIGKLFVENILAAIEHHPDRQTINEGIGILEEYLSPWHEAGKEFVTEPLIDEPELEAPNSTEGDEDSTEDFEIR